jgi:hypothetical protein
MTKIILVVLFIAQLLSFYFILLLNSKISKFKLIEKNQENLVAEMEDTFSVYLLEMKEENDRLIREMAMIKNKQRNNNQHVDVEEQSLVTNLNNAVDIKEQHRSTLNLQQQKASEDDTTQLKVEPMKIVPKSVAANAYKKNSTASASGSSQTNQQPSKPVDEMLQTFESEVLQYYKNGMSVEEIAKKTQKGKTEIELLIKFHA